MRKKWKGLHLPMSLSLSPQQPREQPCVSPGHSSALSRSLCPEARAVKACLQVSRREDHEARSALEKSCVVPGAAGEKLGSQSTTR